MRKIFPFAAALIAVCGLLSAPASGTQESAKGTGLKVFISVDMEGICGVINWDEVSESGPDYGMFRALMTQETNAAIAGAAAAGATEILVRDSHDSGRNILPEMLDPRARLLRDWTYGPLSMMEGIDKTFDAVIFIGYHARANTPNAVLDHTMTTKLLNVSINGKPMPEAGINGLMAGYFGVPVVLISGDQAIARQAKELFGDIETVVVKEAVASAAIMLHPSKAREMIQARTTAALKRLKDFKPLKLAPPYVLEVSYVEEAAAQKASWIPGAVRTNEHTVVFKADDVMDLMKLFRLSKIGI
jgi:D-amino peptidase